MAMGSNNTNCSSDQPNQPQIAGTGKENHNDGKPPSLATADSPTKSAEQGGDESVKKNGRRGKQ